MSETRAAFTARFGEDNAAAIERAAEAHKNGIHDNPGSDAFRWALIIAIGHACLTDYREAHGITADPDAVRAWVREHVDFTAHDGDWVYFALADGAYAGWVPAEDANVMSEVSWPVVLQLTELRVVWVEAPTAEAAEDLLAGCEYEWWEDGETVDGDIERLTVAAHPDARYAIARAAHPQAGPREACPVCGALAKRVGTSDALRHAPHTRACPAHVHYVFVASYVRSATAVGAEPDKWSPVCSCGRWNIEEMASRRLTREQALAMVRDHASVVPHDPNDRLGLPGIEQPDPRALRHLAVAS